jgi:hypothetical protein
VNVVRIKASMSVEEHLGRSRGGRKMLVAEKQCAEDVAEVLRFEPLLGRHTGEGPTIAVLVAAWRKARDSFARVTKALPLDSALRHSMETELAKRDASMNALADTAQAMVAVKLARGDRE